MRAYEASSTIAADPQAIWTILTDGASYPDWDNGVEGLEGRIAPGETIKITASVNPGRAYPIKVVDWSPPRRMSWVGGMPLGLMKGVRTFTLTPQQDGTTRFDMREEFTGPLVPLVWRSMPDLGPSFTQFAEGLKARAEGGA
jgi:hypothetical protein